MSVDLAPALALLDRLVAFDTTSRNSNLGAIDFIRAQLEAAGATCRLTYDDGRAKANLYATLGPSDQPGLLLSGHTDVVPAQAAEWTSDPFRLAERDGRLHGRGTADMKGFLALILALAPRFAQGLQKKGGHKKPLHFAFSYDEEIGCVGARRLIADLETLPLCPALGIVGEPTSMRVIAGHKGKRSMICRVRGREAHSALDRGVNAIEAAARLITFTADLQATRRKNGPFDAAYDPPYSTLTTGVIAGGKALNITPRECRFEFEIRALPSDDADRIEAAIQDHARSVIEPAMQRIDPAAGFEFEIMNDTPGFDLGDGDALVALVRGLTGEDHAGRVSFGTEAGLFNRAGIPVVVCGPGAIEHAHRPDEYVALEQLAEGARFLDLLVEQVCA